MKLQKKQIRNIVMDVYNTLVDLEFCDSTGNSALEIVTTWKQ